MITPSGVMDSRNYKDGVPAGWPGFVSRRENLAAEPRRIGDGNVPAAYGIAVAVVIDSGDVRELEAGSGTEDVYGFLIAPEFSTYTPKPEGGTMGDVLRQGYMTVAVASGDVKANGRVYVRVNNPSDGHPLGEILAENIAGETIAAPGARFVGPSAPAPDGSCVAEIALNL
jgi:hypothetical protein